MHVWNSSGKRSKMNSFGLKHDFSVFNLIDVYDTGNIFISSQELLNYWFTRIEETIIEDTLPADIYLRRSPNSQNSRLTEDAVLNLVTKGAMFWLVNNFETDEYIYPEGVQNVRMLPNSKLLFEWFIIVHHVNYAKALVVRYDEAGIQRGVLITYPHAVKNLCDQLQQRIRN